MSSAYRTKIGLLRSDGPATVAVVERNVRDNLTAKFGERKELKRRVPVHFTFWPQCFKTMTDRG